jgi:hypothetical protein
LEIAVKAPQGPSKRLNFNIYYLQKSSFQPFYFGRKNAEIFTGSGAFPGGILCNLSVYGKMLPGKFQPAAPGGEQEESNA